MGLSLGTHPAIVAAYGIGIESAGSYSFLTEPVLHGDLITFIQPKVSRLALEMPLRARPGLMGSSKQHVEHKNCVRCWATHLTPTSRIAGSL